MTLLYSGEYTSEYIPDTVSDVCGIALYGFKNVHGMECINKTGNVRIT
jgi:hypothetical protein